MLVGLGLLISAGVPLGRLPGDITIRRGNSVIYLPIVTCLVISLVLSVILSLFRR
jgi:hypothetical protein